MRFIANILTDRKFDDCEFYNVVSKKEDLIENIPTLVIGWGFTKELYPEANIINWEIGNNIFWTFNNREKGNRYEETLKKFNKLALNNFIKKILFFLLHFPKRCGIIFRSGEDFSLCSAWNSMHQAELFRF